jgi:hypothetical protein
VLRHRLASLAGALTIGATSVDPFTIDVASLEKSDNKAGTLSNVHPSQSYQGLLVQAGSISGFGPSDFVFTDSNFTAFSPVTQDFSIERIGNDLDIEYRTPLAVPEPETLTMASLAAARLAPAAACRDRERREGSKKTVMRALGWRPRRGPSPHFKPGLDMKGATLAVMSAWVLLLRVRSGGGRWRGVRTDLPPIHMLGRRRAHAPTPTTPAMADKGRVVGLATVQRSVDAEKRLADSATRVHFAPPW